MSLFEPNTPKELKAHYSAVHERLWPIPIKPLPPPIPHLDIPDIEPDPVPASVEEVADRWRGINNRLFNGRITPKSVIYVTASYYGLSFDVITSRSRFSYIVKPRQVSIYIIHLLSRQVRLQCRSMVLVGFSFHKIATNFGIDHATVMHSIARVSERMENDDKCLRQVNDIIALLGR